MVFCAALNCLTDSKSKVSMFKFPANPKLRKQWLLNMKRKEFKPDKNTCICAVHCTEDCFRENLVIRRFLGSDFMPLRLHLKEDAVPTIFFFCSEKKLQGRMPPKAQRPHCPFSFC